jgi:hypothetical protein
VRYLKNRPLASESASPVSGNGKTAPLGGRMQILICALVFNTTCLFIRAVYRVIELSDGWSGRIIRTQVYFSAFYV